MMRYAEVNAALKEREVQRLASLPKCEWEGCIEPCVMVKTGKWSSWCKEHQNATLPLEYWNTHVKPEHLGKPVDRP